MFSNGVNWHSTTSANFSLELSFHLYPDCLHLATRHFSHSPHGEDYQRHILVLRKDKDTTFITDSVRTYGRKGQRVLGKMVWSFSVHTAIDVKKGSVINVVCYERVCYERVCYESGLF